MEASESSSVDSQRFDSLRRARRRLWTMGQVVSFLLFFLVALSVMGGLHYYVWARLVRDTGMATPYRTIASSFIALMGILLPLALASSRLLPRAPLRWLYMVSFGWLGTVFMVFMALLAGDIVKGSVSLASMTQLFKNPALDPDRRLAIARILGLGAAVLGFGGTAVGAVSALGRIPISRVQVSLRKLPAAMNGLRIVQISDIHVGPTIRKDFVARVVEQVNELSPDLIAITGDLVDGVVEELQQHVFPLSKLRARHGVFFVTGNHEYYSGVGPWLVELERLGIRVLRNERVEIVQDGHVIDLIGVDDWTAGRHLRGHGHDLAKATDGRDETRESILLAHQPKAVFDAEKYGIGLQLSGHTHGGQIFPWNFLVRLQQPFVAGLHRVGETLLYINRGTGYWGPPIRVGAPPEITFLELVRHEG